MSPSATQRQPLGNVDFTVNFNSLLQRLDEEFSGIPASPVERFRFSLDGVAFDVRHVLRGKDHCFLISATMGYVPFTIESAERREILKTIVMASRSLPTVHFAIDNACKITASALVIPKELRPPDFIFYPLVVFMQEAGPFIQLIGKYLQAAS